MKIKWKFEDNDKNADEYGNLKTYYYDSEPWKKQNHKPGIILQILKIMLAIVACGIIILIAFSYNGYDWNQSGFKVIRDVVAQRLGIFR
jgi:ABC-type lipoprotein release transport system permease subunit